MSEEKVVPSGYDEEERYFHEKDLELLRRKREALDAVRGKRERDASRVSSWMHCPKCGAKLEEIELRHVKVDQCTECGGIFLDKGEIDQLLALPTGGGFIREFLAALKIR